MGMYFVASILLMRMNMPLEYRMIITEVLEYELPFHGPYHRPSTAILRIRSLMTDRNMAFKIKTTAPKYYSVSPTHGFIEPDNECTVQLTFNGNEQDLRISKIKHKFLIQVTDGPADDDNVDTIAPDRFWKDLNSNSNRNFTIYEHKLQCVFDPLSDQNETSGTISERTKQQFKSFVAAGEEILNPLLSSTENGDNRDSSSTTTTMMANNNEQRRFSLKTLIWAIFAAIVAILAALPIYWNRLRTSKQQSTAAATTTTTTVNNNASLPNDESSHCRMTKTFVYIGVATFMAIIGWAIYHYRKRNV
ncbi:MSP domain containing protein [Euroglyphus maynei]|uniref:MSP domain containing protein n=1 Tax=Euroglyphus maynei TaxID=6958 RepID=A0A1Y3BWI5_EURMA|nr:MSP domain containing protein [Euroglyphus maynei]